MNQTKFKKITIYVILFVIINIVITASICCLWRKSASQDQVSFRECEYQYESEDFNVQLYYPQLTGSIDTEKEQRINELIEGDIKKVLEWNEPDEYGRPLYIGVRRYEIKYANENIISIAYYRRAGRVAAGGGLPSTMFATTIDTQNERILELSDVVDDFDTLYEELWNDRFEHITKWEGQAGDYKISTDFFDEKRLKEVLWNGGVEWYVEGENFVIADLEYQGCGVGYNEYAQRVSKLKGIFKDGFLKMLGM